MIFASRSDRDNLITQHALPECRTKGAQDLVAPYTIYGGIGLTALIMLSLLHSSGAEETASFSYMMQTTLPPPKYLLIIQAEKSKDMHTN